MHRTSHSHLIKCNECDNTVIIPRLHSRLSAICPRCHHIIKSGNRWTLSQSAAIAVTLIILMPFSFLAPLISINLLEVPSHASVIAGIWNMAINYDAFTALMILICSIIMPITFASLILILWFAKIFNYSARIWLITLKYIKPWVMLDVYLVSLAVTVVKVVTYSALDVGLPLATFTLTAVLTTLLFIKINPMALWEEFYPELSQPDTHIPITQEHLAHCSNCDFSFLKNKDINNEEQHYCPRCHTKTNVDDNTYLQRCWACIIASIIMLIPANTLPISFIYINGVQSGDTLLSGVLLFISSGSYFVAFIVFVASIFVPITKIGILIYLLIQIQIKSTKHLLLKMKLLRFVHFVGRWSMLDLFVLALMSSLIERGQIISFNVGPAALYFGVAVFLTMIATEQFNARLLWKYYDQRENNSQ